MSPTSYPKRILGSRPELIFLIEINKPTKPEMLKKMRANNLAHTFPFDNDLDTNRRTPARHIKKTAMLVFCGDKLLEIRWGTKAIK